MHFVKKHYHHYLDLTILYFVIRIILFKHLSFKGLVITDCFLCLHWNMIKVMICMWTFRILWNTMLKRSHCKNVQYIGQKSLFAVPKNAKKSSLFVILCIKKTSLRHSFCAHGHGSILNDIHQASFNLINIIILIWIFCARFF